MRQHLEEWRDLSRHSAPRLLRGRRVRMICLAMVCAAVFSHGTATVKAATAEDQNIAVPANRATVFGLKVSFTTEERRFILFEGIRLISGPMHGTVTFDYRSTDATYTPHPDFVGADSFIYAVRIANRPDVTAAVTITVRNAVVISDVTVSEGSSGTAAARFTVSVGPPHPNSVSLSYRTLDGTARAGTDYVGTTGSLNFPPRIGSQVITIPVIGDRLLEPHETFTVQLFNASSLVIIADGRGLGSILDDDGIAFLVGAPALTPADSIVRVGERIDLNLAWTHPVGWRQLDSIDLLILDDEGKILATRWHEAANSFSRIHPTGGRRVRTAPANSPTRFQSSGATLYLKNSTGGGPPGQTVTVDYDLSFKRRAAGRTFRVEAAATDDAGNQQAFEQVGTITVLPR